MHSPIRFPMDVICFKICHVIKFFLVISELDKLIWKLLSRVHLMVGEHHGGQFTT